MPAQASNQVAIFRWIVEHTPEKGRVLDIGCAEGDLLARLVTKKGVHGTGIELSEECVVKAVQRGLSVHHGDAEEGMDHYSDDTFDLVVVSRAIQEMAHPVEMVHEAFRIGKQLLIVFPNFGYWRVRWQLALLGHAPTTPSFPHSWHGSPNRHFFTVSDWEDLCAREGWSVVDSGFLTGGRLVKTLPNLLAELGMYLMVNKK